MHQKAKFGNFIQFPALEFKINIFIANCVETVLEKCNFAPLSFIFHVKTVELLKKYTHRYIIDASLFRSVYIFVFLLYCFMHSLCL